MKALRAALVRAGLRADGKARSLIRRADQARNEKSWCTAAQLYGDALALSPARADIWVQYGHALKESGQRPEAEQAYRKALSIAPLQSDTHIQLGHLLKLMGRLTEAGQAYLQAFRLDPGQYDTLRELTELSRRGVRFPQESLVQAIGDGSPSGPETAPRHETTLADLHAREAGETGAGDATPAPVIVFDVADLFAYFGAARLPTGIQRVQIEVISSLLRLPDAGGAHVCVFSEALDTWVEIPRSFFLELAALSLSSGDRSEPAWKKMMLRLGLYMIAAKPTTFPTGAFLVNLGTSWWLQNYFLQIRRAKAEYGIHYIPFVHDFIPVITPEHCVKGLTLDFIAWTLGVFQHAEFFLVNSQATKKDLLSVANHLGHSVDEAQVKVIRLDADFRKPAIGVATRTHNTFGLQSDAYVLFVSTIESRKNHLGALSAWLGLIDKHGSQAIPKLVCVGNEGWLNDAVHEKLRSSKVLAERVVMLSKLSDAELSDLYKHCLFTLYPSHYEGWGLPITKSLCYGKVPLISDASSLPEAGGTFAEYFEAGSDAALEAALERLIFEPGLLQAKERVIAERFKPRAWQDIGDEIKTSIAAWSEAVASARPAPPAMPAGLGVYYSLQRNQSTRIWPGMVAGEMFRTGSGWWWPEDWGGWTRPQGGEITVQIPGPHGRLRAFFGVRSPGGHASDWCLKFNTPSEVGPVSGSLGPGERGWIGVDFPASETGLTIQALLRGVPIIEVSPSTDGYDEFIRLIGLEGFYVYECDDQDARINFLEAVATNTLERLSSGYKARHLSIAQSPVR